MKTFLLVAVLGGTALDQSPVFKHSTSHQRLIDACAVAAAALIAAFVVHMVVRRMKNGRASREQGPQFGRPARRPARTERY